MDSSSPQRLDTDLLDAVAQLQSDILAVSLDANRVLDLVVDRAQTLTGADGAIFAERDERSLIYQRATGIAAPWLCFRTDIEKGLSAPVLSSGGIFSHCESNQLHIGPNSGACGAIIVRSMVAVPVMSGTSSIGVLKVVSANPLAFEERHVSALRLIAGLLAASLAHASEFEARRQLLAEKGAALDSARLSNSALRESEERFRSSFDNAAIGMALVTLDGRWAMVNRSMCEILGYSEEELLQTTFQAITHPEDLQADLAFVQRLLASEIRTYQMIKRYFHKQGRVVWALLSVSLVRHQNGEPLYFIAQVQDITDQRRNEWLEVARGKVLEMIAADRPLQPVLDELIHLVEAQLVGSIAAVMVLDEGDLRLVKSALPAAFAIGLQARSISIASSLCAHAAGTEPPLTVSHLTHHPAWEPVRSTALQFKTDTCWSVPIRSKDGSFLALLMVFLADREQPDPRETRVLETAAKLAVVAIEHFQMTRQLAFLARHDSLTGLPNRIVFEDRLQQALAQAKRSGDRVALFGIDLDHFKSVNDRLGHHSGDALLQQFARRLKSQVREGDTVARVGGDEFVVVLPDMTRSEDAIAVARKLVSALSEPFSVAGECLAVTGSIGIAVYPEDGEEAATLQRAADAALYRVKQRGRNGFELAGDVVVEGPDADLPSCVAPNVLTEGVN